jgi:predicted Zn-dependent protease
MPPAGVDDWLGDGNPGEKDRAGQPVVRFLRPGPHRTFPMRSACKVYLCPLGDVSEAPAGHVLCDLLQRWLTLEVVLLKPAVKAKAFLGLPRCEEGCGYGAQLETPGVHELCYKLKPRDAFAVVAYTMADICHTEKGFGFLFGQAQLDKGVGVFSFARYRDDAPSQALFLRRCGMVLVHECLHLFGIAHCVYGKCVMNGSNHLAESESRPFALCPVDLRKLSATINDARLPSGQLDIVARERAMLEWFEVHGLDSDAAFTRRCLASLGQPVPPLAETAVAALSINTEESQSAEPGAHVLGAEGECSPESLAARASGASLPRNDDGTLW